MGVKVKIVGKDIFTDKKQESVVPGSGTVQVPVITKKDYQLIDISDDNYLSLMDDNRSMREDLLLPEGELGQKIKQSFENAELDVIVQTTSALGHEQVTDFKLSKE